MRRALFWPAAALLAYAQVGYGALLAAVSRRRGPDADGPPPRVPVSLVIAAYDEEASIAGKVANARALRHPEALEIVVAADGCSDATVDRARAAGADLVLDLPRGGKVRAQDTAVREARGDIIAFGDANALWEPDALEHLLAPFADPAVGYVCGQVAFVNDGGTNQEGLYWRYELFLRERESWLSSVTAGNGAIYAVRRAAYAEGDPVMGHDLRLPYTVVRAGWKALYAPQARAVEKMVPSIEGEFARKRRMMSHAWAIVLRGGLLDLRGLPALYALLLVSHRWLRYVGPFLHLIALASGRAKAPQLALLAAAAAGGRVRSRPLLIARYYVLTQASIALGLVDHLRHGTEAGWEAPEGTR